jgi:hypothetical protein
VSFKARAGRVGGATALALAAVLAGTLGPGGAIATAGAAPVSALATSLTPDGLATNSSGDLYIADRFNDVVDEVTPSGELTVVAGVPGHAGTPKAGPATESDLSSPAGLAVDGNNDLYIADAGGNQVVEKVTPEGELSIVAGVPGLVNQAVKPGKATQSELFGAFGVAVDGEDNLFIDDELHAVVDKVTPSGTLSIAAGTSDTFGSPSSWAFESLGTPAPGSVSSRHLYLAYGIAEAGGYLYIDDTGSHIVEKVGPSGEAQIVAGDGADGAPVEGPAEDSPLGLPMGVAVDGEGNVYIADAENNVVEKINPAGELSVIAGTGDAGPPEPGPATSSDLDRPMSVAVDGKGDVFIADEGNNVVEEVNTKGMLSIVAGTGAGVVEPTPPARSVKCYNEALTGTYAKVTVTAGGSCTLEGAHVNGSVHATGATSVTVTDSYVGENLSVVRATSGVSIAGSTVGKTLHIASTSGAVVVRGSTIAHSVTIKADTGPLTFENNQITESVSVRDNSGPPESTLVLGNDVGRTIKCLEDPDLAVGCNVGGSSG